MKLSRTTARALMLPIAALAMLTPSVGQALATPPPGFRDSDYVMDAFLNWHECEAHADMWERKGYKAKCVPASWKSFPRVADLYVRK